MPLNESLINNVSSAKDIILSGILFTLTPHPFDSTLSMSSSMMMLNRSGERGQPCLTPELMLIGLLFPSGS